MAITRIHTGHTPSTTAQELEERAERERRLAAVLEHDGHHRADVRARIIQHENQAAVHEADIKAVRGW